MLVSGYSVQHDPEVQEYNARRAAWKASEKERKQREKVLREQGRSTRKSAVTGAESRSLRPCLKEQKQSKALDSQVQDCGSSAVWGTRESDEITLSEALSL